MTHPAPTASDACYLYNLAIKILLEKFEDPIKDRAKECFSQCSKESETFKLHKTFGGREQEQNIKAWLEKAESLYKEFKKDETKEPLLVHFKEVRE